jgi:sporulation protein YlmC with PRC-barrel domain
MSDTLKQSTDSRLIAADKVQGTAVFDRRGERLGTVKDIYIDKRSGQAEYASMSVGGVLGVGARYHPVPWEILDYDVDKDGFVVDLDKDALEAAPAYADEDLDAADYGWRTEVIDYFSTR